MLLSLRHFLSNLQAYNEFIYFNLIENLEMSSNPQFIDSGQQDFESTILAKGQNQGYLKHPRFGHSHSRLRLQTYNCDGFGHKAKECWYSHRHIMKHTFNRPVIKTRRDNSMMTPWKYSGGQGHPPKGTSMRKVSPELAKTWKRKTDSKQSEKADTEESKYFGIIGHLPEEDSANTKGSDLDNTEILRKEARKIESLMKEECE